MWWASIPSVRGRQLNRAPALGQGRSPDPEGWDGARTGIEERGERSDDDQQQMTTRRPIDSIAAPAVVLDRIRADNHAWRLFAALNGADPQRRPGRRHVPPGSRRDRDRGRDPEGDRGPRGAHEVETPVRRPGGSLVPMRAVSAPVDGGEGALHPSRRDPPPPRGPGRPSIPTGLVDRPAALVADLLRATAGDPRAHRPLEVARAEAPGPTTVVQGPAPASAGATTPPPIRGTCTGGIRTGAVAGGAEPCRADQVGAHEVTSNWSWRRTGGSRRGGSNGTPSIPTPTADPGTRILGPDQWEAGRGGRRRGTRGGPHGHARCGGRGRPGPRRRRSDHPPEHRRSTALRLDQRGGEGSPRTGGGPVGPQPAEVAAIIAHVGRRLLGRRPRHPDRHGRAFGAQVTATPWRSRDGPVITSTVDVSHRTEALADLTHQLSHDGLTGLRNRSSFTDAIDDRMAASRIEGRGWRPGARGAGGPGAQNRAHGIEMGDRVIRASSVALRHAVHPGDLVALFSSDSFAVWCDTWSRTERRPTPTTSAGRRRPSRRWRHGRDPSLRASPCRRIPSTRPSSAPGRHRPACGQGPSRASVPPTTPDGPARTTARRDGGPGSLGGGGGRAADRLPGDHPARRPDRRRRRGAPAAGADRRGGRGASRGVRRGRSGRAGSGLGGLVLEVPAPRRRVA